MVTLDPDAVRESLGAMPDASGLGDLPEGGWHIDVAVADGTVRVWVQLVAELHAGQAGLHLVSPVLSGQGGLGTEVARHALAAAADEAAVRIGWCPAPDGSGPVLAAVSGLTLDDLDVAEIHDTLRGLAEIASRLQITLQPDEA